MKYPAISEPLLSSVAVGEWWDGEYWQAHIVDSESTGQFSMVRYPTKAEALVASVEWVVEEKRKKSSNKF